MRLERLLNPIENWHSELSSSEPPAVPSNGFASAADRIARYYISVDADGYDVLYELVRQPDGTWKPRVSADGNVVFDSGVSYPTPSDALAALSKRVGVL